MLTKELLNEFFTNRFDSYSVRVDDDLNVTVTDNENGKRLLAKNLKAMNEIVTLHSASTKEELFSVLNRMIANI